VADVLVFKKREAMKLENNRLVEDIGEYTCTSPAIPARSEFLNGDVKKRELQKFVRTEMPAVFKKPQKSWTRHEEQEAMEFMRQEWDRRVNGVFFMNCGQITYLTGVHYFYLCYNPIDSGYPDYREADRRFFWLWKHCEDDPYCFGLLYITRRQQGKSYKLGCILLEYATRVERCHCGIQSKSDTDAKKLFERAIVRAWKKLPYFFSPIYRNPNPPKEALEFYAPAANSRRAKATDGSVMAGDEKESTLDFRPSQEEAYDGAKLARYGRDEAFKQQIPDPMKACSIVKRTMEQPIPGKGVQIIGKMLVTSTIQEIEGKGVERATEAWRDADPGKVDANGHTPSGLKRYFQPVWEGHEIDEYGRDNVEKSRQYFQNRRDAFIKSGDLTKLEAEIRANPFDIDEALEGRANEGIFNSMHLARNITTLKNLPAEKKPQRYDLVFNKERTKVRAVPNRENGKFLISWLPPDEMMNRVVSSGTLSTPQGLVQKYKPKNDVQFAIGCDPYDKMVVTDKKRASKAAAYGFVKFNPNVEAENKKCLAATGKESLGYYPTHSFFVEYVNRPAAPSIFYNDMIALCHWLGCALHFENQKNNIEAFFENKGYKDFLMDRPDYTHTDNTKKQEAKGTPSSTLTKGFYADLLIEFAQWWVGYDEEGETLDWRHLPFEHLLNDMKEFKLTETQIYDATVAAGFTLMSAQKYTRPPQDAKGAGAVLTVLENVMGGVLS
jgi:hypothetical protein